jgi:tricorn protease
MKQLQVFLIILLFSISIFSYAGEEARLLRFPAVYDNQVVFSYAGDLFTVSKDGGVARKLTSHKGYEVFPKFSTDGKYLAFTGQYDGNTEVYLMDAQGGIPKRLTYTANLGRDDVSDRMGPNNIVMGWKHNSKQIIFRSRMIEANSFNGQLFLTNLEGGLHERVSLPRSGFCSYSPDDTQLAFNRVFREFRTWKRYRGGMADDIWVYNFSSKKTINITNNPAQDIFPMWREDKIYFLSDRGPHERMNLYAYDTKSKTSKRLTDFNDFDIKFPSLGKDAIAFENGGYIYLFNVIEGKLNKLKIYINEDRLHARGGIKNVKKNITDYTISPDGKRALFGARGEVFTVPAKYGNTRNLTGTSGAHERNSHWSPDGKWIAFISDKSGESEIYVVAPDGRSKPVRITTGGNNYKFQFKWSPDSKKILWSDRMFRLRYVDIDKKVITDVARSKIGSIKHYDWSPDSKWISYADFATNQFLKVFLYSLENKKQYSVTEGWYQSDYPHFSSCGKYLYFISDRDFNPTEGGAEMRFIFPDMSGIYMVTLAKSTASPFEPKSDEVAVKKTQAPAKKKSAKSKKSSAKKSMAVTVKIDTDGISDRVIKLRVSASRYGNLVSTKGKLYYMRRGSKDKKPLLMMFDLEKRKESNLGDVSGFEISADHKKMLIKKSKAYGIIPLPSSKPSIKESLNLSHLEMELCFKCEWKNIFYASWRQMRDFFYVKNMHGVNWENMKKRYEPLLKHVNHRNDLTYIIGEMLGELNVGHAYVGGGERPKLNKVNVGLLGAELERDVKTGYYRIEKILKGQNWNKQLVSPLTVVGVTANEGDYILAINGKDTAKMKNLHKALNNTAGKQVRLTLNTKPSMMGSREEVVVPVASVLQLYYYNWVRDNIEKVSKATNGKVGYIHIPDMGLGGLVEFMKLYHPQLHKKALIIDVRGNGGGFVSELVVERLRREMVMVDYSRHSSPTVNPLSMMYGPMVCLQDEFSASDGDLFPFRFKKHKMGKLIGKRTWGGVVGINNSLPFLDGGTMYIPAFASYDLEGKRWIIEGHGVDPDIVVENDPAQEFAGNDQQLNRGIKEILEDLKTSKKVIPPPPPDPDKGVGKKY